MNLQVLRRNTKFTGAPDQHDAGAAAARLCYAGQLAHPLLPRRIVGRDLRAGSDCGCMLARAEKAARARDQLQGVVPRQTALVSSPPTEFHPRFSYSSKSIKLTTRYFCVTPTGRPRRDGSLTCTGEVRISDGRVIIRYGVLPNK